MYYTINQTHMGDVSEKIRGHLLPGMTVVFTAAPPCKDHSQIREAPPGITGQDGSWLQHTVNIELSLRQLLPDHPIETLMEHVLPHENVQSHFDDITDQWGSTPIMYDSSDGNMVSRPRLWWNTTHWPEVQHVISTQTPWQLQWSQKTQYQQLHNPISPDLQPSILIKGWETPNILTQGGLFHCLTTQAPTDPGRPPPPQSNVDQATWDLWEYNKQFPPWQYKPQCLTRHNDGEWTTITPIQRERLMATGQLHTERNTRHTRQTKEHHVGERLASPHRRVADVFSTTLSDSNDPNITQDLRHRPDDKSLAQQPMSVRTSQKSSEDHTHTCHNLIGNQSQMGQTTS